MLSVGVLTFLTRLSFIYLLEKWQPPEVIGRINRDLHSGNGPAKRGIGVVFGKHSPAGRDDRHPGGMADKKRAVDDRSGNGVFLGA